LALRLNWKIDQGVVSRRSRRTCSGFAWEPAISTSFKVYYTDPVRGRPAPSLPPGALPLAFPTEYEALKVAMQAIRLGRIVWRIERPDGTVITREEIEFIYQGQTGE